MSRRLGALIAVVALASGALLVSAAFWYRSIGLGISIDKAPDGVWLGVLFWILLTIVAASLPVRMPGGSFLDVGSAPIIAAMSLGGPIVAGLVALFGGTQPREIRRKTPLHGVIANHAGITGPAIVGAYALSIVPSRNNAADRHGRNGRGSVHILFPQYRDYNGVVVSARERRANREAREGGRRRLLVNMLALAPVAWLMATDIRGGRLVGCPALCRSAVHHSAGLSACCGSPRRCSRRPSAA